MKILLVIALAILSFLAAKMKSDDQPAVLGAWTAKQGNTSYTLVFQDDYFSFVSFDIPGKQFIHSYGGTFTMTNEKLAVKIEFDTKTKEEVGIQKIFTAIVRSNTLTLDTGNGIRDWTRVDDGKDALAGNWRISGRMRNGQLEAIPVRARKTIKLLSGTRFQWMAINTETKEFFGTGGGTYTFKDGKYTEHIEFFSRDSSRVGAALIFDGSINNKVWTHKGLSSKGEPIHEEWTREK